MRVRSAQCGMRILIRIRICVRLPVPYPYAYPSSLIPDHFVPYPYPRVYACVFAECVAYMHICTRAHMMHIGTCTLRYIHGPEYTYEVLPMYKCCYTAL